LGLLLDKPKDADEALSQVFLNRVPLGAGVSRAAKRPFGGARRPIIDTGKLVLAGFTAEVRAKLTE